MGTVQATVRPTIDVDAVAEAAKSGPVTVRSGDREAFVALDVEAFRRLSEEAERARRIVAGREAVAIARRIRADAAGRATPDEIAKIERELADED